MSENVEYEVQVFEDGEFVAAVVHADKDIAMMESRAYMPVCAEITNVTLVVRRIETVQTIKIGDFDE